MSPTTLAPRPVASRSSRASRRLLVLAAALILLFLAATGQASAAVQPITAAPPLEWGFKQSWRVYAGVPATAAGAERTPQDWPGVAGGYTLAWQFDAGSYDDATRATEVRYRGEAHWRKYEGYDGLGDGEYALDLALRDPIVTISAARAVVSAEIVSRDLQTRQLTDAGRVDVAALAIDQVTPVIDGGTVSWPAMSAALTAEAQPLFASEYRPRQALDPVGFSYTGPGGAPDLSEHFDPAGQIKLALRENTILETGLTLLSGSSFTAWAEEPARGLIHHEVVRGGASRTLETFDAATMQRIGGGLPIDSASPLAIGFYDSTSARFYLKNAAGEVDRWLHFDRDTAAFVQGTLTTPIPDIPTGLVAWDPQRALAYRVARTSADGGEPSGSNVDAQQWRLLTWKESADGWTRTDYRLPDRPAGQNASWMSGRGVTAVDGSYLFKADGVSGPGAPDTIPAAYAVELDEPAGAATVRPVRGTQLPNTTSTWRMGLANGHGQVLMTRAGGSLRSAAVITIDMTDSDGPVAGPILDLGDFDGIANAAVDPDDGTFWFSSTKSERVVGIEDDRVVADQVFEERNANLGTFLGAPGHRLVMGSDNRDAYSPFFYGTYGYAQLERVGRTATITQQPADREVVLGPGHDGADVTFQVATAVTPSAALQWQVKRPGEFRFSDLVGDVGATLHVTAEPLMEGTQYRVIASNAAGRVASDVATLGVQHAPRLTRQPSSATVSPGQDASFEVLGDGFPEPQLQWQRRVAGFWQSIAADDDNFVISGGQLTVKDANLEQSGTLLRARLRNAAGSVYSSQARLTVHAPQAQALHGVRLEWEGSEELQRRAPNGAAHYFSAGASDGSATTYATADRGVTILHRRAGVESTPSWDTRDAYLAGGRQLVRLDGGDGELAADGAVSVQWPGAFSFNMYGGLVPFTMADLQLRLDADGNGTLTATLSGYASSIHAPEQRTVLAPVAEVVLATFANGRIDPEATGTLAPVYAGVEVDAPEGALPQQRSGSGWGAWPASFVDFQHRTGLGSYWYTSGGAVDPYKPPLPFAISVTGARGPSTGDGGPPAPAAPGGPAVPLVVPLLVPVVVPQSMPRAAPPELAEVRTSKRSRRVRRSTGVAAFATVNCLAGPCRISHRSRMRVRMAGHRHVLRVTGPREIASGESRALNVRLSRAAVRSLRRTQRRVRFVVPVTVTTDAGAVRRKLRVALR